MYDTTDDGLDLVYLVVGKMTQLMAQLKPLDTVEIWGPLGNGFPSYAGVDHLVLVAGGIGQTPFPALAQRALGRKGYSSDAPGAEVKRISLLYGARTAELFAGLDDFRAAGVEVQLATDDGSHGFRGFVTQLLETKLSDRAKSQKPGFFEKPGFLGGSAHLVGCGPEPMLHALAALAQKHHLPCHLSLETPMACGVGICFSCVTRVKTADGWDYRRVCVDGPVFDVNELVWASR